MPSWIVRGMRSPTRRHDRRLRRRPDESVFVSFVIFVSHGFFVAFVVKTACEALDTTKALGLCQEYDRPPLEA